MISSTSGLMPVSWLRLYHCVSCLYTYMVIQDDNRWFQKISFYQRHYSHFWDVVEKSKFRGTSIHPFLLLFQFFVQRIYWKITVKKYKVKQFWKITLFEEKTKISLNPQKSGYLRICLFSNTNFDHTAIPIKLGDSLFPK